MMYIANVQFIFVPIGTAKHFVLTLLSLSLSLPLSLSLSLYSPLDHGPFLFLNPIHRP
jgi:hypothetical protein